MHFIALEFGELTIFGFQNFNQTLSEIESVSVLGDKRL